MAKTLNIAVIGAGTMAQAVHLPVLRRRWDRFTVAALVDHSPRRRREASDVWGVAEEKRYETVADLIAAVRVKEITVDAALLSTDGLHAQDLLALMRRGIPVLVEPPVGFSAQEIAQVADFERMTGRPLLMLAYPQQYDDSVREMGEVIARKDVRMVDHEVLMPASQPLFGAAKVTSSAYDLPSEKRSQRRKDLQAAVEAGSGEGATQRDRDLYVKGLLTGVAHQLAVLEAAYGPLVELSMARHWPKGVIPGSIELLGELEGGARVRLVWHYLPFAPEYRETVQVLSARRRLQLDLPAPSHGDRRSTLALREKKSGVVQETTTVATNGSAEAMWEAFHAFVEKGEPPIAGTRQALAQVELLREVLARIVEADGRTIDPESDEEGTEEAAGAAVAGEADAAESAAGADAADEPGAGEESRAADGAGAAQVSGASSALAGARMTVDAEPADAAREEPTEAAGEEPAVSVDAGLAAEPVGEPAEPAEAATTADPAPFVEPDEPAAGPAEPVDRAAAPTAEQPVVDAWTLEDADQTAAPADQAAAPADQPAAPADQPADPEPGRDSQA